MPPPSWPRAIAPPVLLLSFRASVQFQPAGIGAKLVPLFSISTLDHICRRHMPYPEMLIAPMRQDLTRFGVEELRTAADVDRAVTGTAGTLMIVINSVCGCAAGKARPGVALALRHDVRPDHVATVFAGFDEQATARARSYCAGVPPSSPSIALFRGGALVYMLERRHIENRDAQTIAAELTAAFDKFCSPKAYEQI